MFLFFCWWLDVCVCVCVFWTLIDRRALFLTGEGVPLQVGAVRRVRRGNEDVACASPVAR
jgi:hypothetical protein